MNTLRFGNRAKSIKCAVKQNTQKSAKELEAMVDRLKMENKLLREGRGDEIPPVFYYCLFC